MSYRPELSPDAIYGRAPAPGDLEALALSAANSAADSAESALRAENIIADIDEALVGADSAVAIAQASAEAAEGFKNSAQQAREGADSSAAVATAKATIATDSAASAASSAASVNKGQPNGTAPLDASAKLPEANVPTRLTEQAQKATIVDVGTANFVTAVVSASDPYNGASTTLYLNGVEL